MSETPSTALTAPVQTGQPATRISVRASLNTAYMTVMQDEKKALDKLIQDFLVEGVDYGTIKGTKKPTLYKAGAENVTQAYDCQGVFEIIEREAEHDRVVQFKKAGGNRKSDEVLGLYRYVIRCKLIHRPTGVVVAEGLGACSTMESKYIDRPRDCENTVLKMAKKRSHVDAVLGGFGLSERFTQDMEDTGISVGDDHEATAPVVKEGTLEWAKLLPLPGDKNAWGGHGGTPLGALKPKLLQRVQDWADGQIKAQTGSKAAPRLKLACELLLQDHEDTRLDAAAARDSAPSLSDDAPAAAPAPVATPVPAAAVAPTPPSADLASHAPALDDGLPSALVDEEDDLPF